MFIERHFLFFFFFFFGGAVTASGESGLPLRAVEKCSLRGVLPISTSPGPRLDDSRNRFGIERRPKVSDESAAPSLETLRQHFSDRGITALKVGPTRPRPSLRRHCDDGPSSSSPGLYRIPWVRRGSSILPTLSGAGY